MQNDPYLIFGIIKKCDCKWQISVNRYLFKDFAYSHFILFYFKNINIFFQVLSLGY